MTNAQIKNHMITTYHGKLMKPHMNIEPHAGKVRVDNICLTPVGGSYDAGFSARIITLIVYPTCMPTIIPIKNIYLFLVSSFIFSPYSLIFSRSSSQAFLFSLARFKLKTITKISIARPMMTIAVFI